MPLTVLDYKPEYQPYFEKFNKAWLEEYFKVEPLDKYVLEQPGEAIIAHSGKIYFVADGDNIIGTVALRFIEEGVFELTKMAVDKNYRGGGAGKLLCATAIAKAKELGVKRLILFSNRILKNAIHIYEKLGFVEIPVKPGTYKRSDIMMEIIMTTLPIQQLRAETKGTATTVHFNNAGSSLPPDIVVNTVIDYLREEAIYGGYETEYNYREQLDNTYALIAKLINASKDEVAIVENASAGWWIAFNGLDLNPGDVILTSEMEYVTNVIGLVHAKKTMGITIKVIPNDNNGDFCLQALEEAITPQVKLIAVTHVGSTVGSVMPVAEIGAVARKYNILYLLDACQSIGHLPVDVEAIQCDMLAVTGRKYLRAPRGTGFLYVRKSLQHKLKPAYMDGFSSPTVTADDYTPRNDARRFELYEKSRALTLGLGKAVEYALAVGIDNIWQRIQYLSGLLRSKLAGVEGVTVHDIGTVQCGIVTFSVKNVSAYIVKNKLQEKRINTSVGKAISTPFYMEKYGLDSVVRASVHYYNTEEEIEILCDALKAI